MDRLKTNALGGDAGDSTMKWFRDTPIELDSWDMMNGRPTNGDVRQAWDGFWMVVHEMVHCFYDLKGENPAADPPAGAPEQKLNQLRLGFGLKRRISYTEPHIAGSNTQSFSFDGGGLFTYDTSPDRKAW
jgi:hypothetical protein